MNRLTLSLTEIIQLSALGPCFFIVIYLLFSARNYSLITIPIIYFLSLTATFTLPILAIFPSINTNFTFLLIKTNESLVPALSFLLITQLIERKPPPTHYWLIIAVPIFGGGPFVHLSINTINICYISDYCVNSQSTLQLYNIFSGALIFLLITLILSRQSHDFKQDENKKHKYWLIVMLIIYNILVLITHLQQLRGSINTDDAALIKAMIGVALIYLVISSVFRVFNKNFNIKPLVRILSNKDERIANKIVDIMNNDKPYLIAGFNRGELSDQLGLTEQHLSKIINTSFNKSFTDLINSYRINTAKEILINSNEPITEVAYKSGFNSIATFNRVFKENTSHTPRNFRKDKRENNHL